MITMGLIMYRGYYMAARRYEISLRVLKIISCCEGAMYHVAIATVIFSHVKISCFRAKAHLVFHWYLYNKLSYYRLLCGDQLIKKLFPDVLSETPTEEQIEEMK